MKDQIGFLAVALGTQASVALFTWVLGTTSTVYWLLQIVMSVFYVGIAYAVSKLESNKIKKAERASKKSRAKYNHKRLPFP